MPYGDFSKPLFELPMVILPDVSIDLQTSFHRPVRSRHIPGPDHLHHPLRCQDLDCLFLIRHLTIP